MDCRIIFIEDNKQDVKLMQRELTAAGFNVIARQVSTKVDFIEALDTFNADIVLADYTLPVFNGMHAFRLFKDKGFSIPFILVTGSLNEKLALECQSEGVDDFIMKTSFKRLPDLVTRNLKLKELEKERLKMTSQLEQKNAEFKALLEKAEKARTKELLSNREYEILCLIASGKQVKEIAEDLFLSPATIATYRSRLLEKLELKSNVDLVKYAIHNKLITD